MGKKNKKNKKNKKRNQQQAITLSPELQAFVNQSTKQFRKGKKQAEAEGNSFKNLPDGVYIASITDCEVSQSQSSGRWQLKVEWTVLEDDQQGKTTFQFFGLESSDQIKFLNWWLARFDIDAAEDAGDLVVKAAEILLRHPKCRIQLRTRGEYQNCRVKKFLEDLGESVPSGKGKSKDTETDTDDDNSNDDDDVTIEGDDEHVLIAKGDSVKVKYGKGRPKKATVLKVNPKKHKAKVLLTASEETVVVALSAVV